MFLHGERFAELNQTVKFENEGYYMIRGQVFNADSVDNTSRYAISEQYIEHIDIGSASARVIE
jgi:hypothetical protein